MSRTQSTFITSSPNRQGGRGAGEQGRHGFSSFPPFSLSPLLLSLLLLLVTFNFTSAQEAPPALTLEQALTLAPNVNATVISGKTNLAAAQRDLERVSNDPLSLRLEKLQAEQKVASEQENLNKALLSSRLDVTDKFFAALEADQSLANAQKQLEIANATLEAQQIRFEAGAITQIDLSKAQNDAVNAERTVRDAQNTRNLAYSQLGNVVGQNVSALAPYEAEAPGLPPLEEVQQTAMTENTQLKTLQRAVDLARTQLEITDNDFSSRSQIDSAKDTLANAELNLSDYQSTLGLTIESSYNNVVAAQTSYQNALEAYQTSADDLAAQQTRLDAGSISPIAFRQSELTHAQNLAALDKARHQLFLAHIRLEQAVMGQTTTQAQ